MSWRTWCDKPRKTVTFVAPRNAVIQWDKPLAALVEKAIYRADEPTLVVYNLQYAVPPKDDEDDDWPFVFLQSIFSEEYSLQCVFPRQYQSMMAEKLLFDGFERSEASTFAKEGMEVIFQREQPLQWVKRLIDGEDHPTIPPMDLWTIPANLDHFFANLQQWRSVDDISRWDVRHVTNMNGIFKNADLTDQDVTGWRLDSLETAEDAFLYCDGFDYDFQQSWARQHPPLFPGVYVDPFASFVWNLRDDIEWKGTWVYAEEKQVELYRGKTNTFWIQYHIEGQIFFFDFVGAANASAKRGRQYLTAPYLQPTPPPIPTRKETVTEAKYLFGLCCLYAKERHCRQGRLYCLFGRQNPQAFCLYSRFGFDIPRLDHRIAIHRESVPMAVNWSAIDRTAILQVMMGQQLSVSTNRNTLFCTHSRRQERIMKTPQTLKQDYWYLKAHGLDENPKMQKRLSLLQRSYWKRVDLSPTHSSPSTSPNLPPLEERLQTHPVPSPLTNENIKQAVLLWLAGTITTPIEEWDVRGVTNMDSLFANIAIEESLPIGSWDVSNVRSMDYMFFNCRVFNASLEGWNVGQVTSAECMFEHCLAFEGKGLERWDVKSLVSGRNMFKGCVRFSAWLHRWPIRADLIVGDEFLPPSYPRKRVLQSWRRSPSVLKVWEWNQVADPPIPWERTWEQLPYVHATMAYWKHRLPEMVFEQMSYTEAQQWLAPFFRGKKRSLSDA